MTEVIDVIVIGAGPAGMAAASWLQSRGVRTLVLEERPEPGGNVHAGALHGPFGASDLLGKEYAKGAAAAREFARGPVSVCHGCSIHRVDGNTVTFSQGGELRRVAAARLIVATGAMERPMPFPGWELPGVMGAGAFQLLMKQSGLVPGVDYVLAGTGPLLLLVACQLLALGSRPVAILDTNAASPFMAGACHAAAMAASPAAVWKGLGYLARIRRAGVRVIDKVVALAAEGSDSVETLRYWRRDGSTGALPAGLVLCNEGVIPNIHLTLALQCRHSWNEAQTCMAPVVDAHGETTRNGTFVAGDAAGILGAEAAPHSAMLAAAKIALDLGRITAEEADRETRAAQAALARQRRFRAFLDAAYRPGIAAVHPIADETLICRCEEVSAGALRQAVRDGALGPTQAKMFTRCGMGPCQGRICGSAMTRILSEATGESPGRIGNRNVRFPLKPLSLEELASGPDAEQADHEIIS